MATNLDPQRRAQLDGIVQKMQANGESDDYIQSVVNDFKAKYSGGGQKLIATPGLGARLKNRALAWAPDVGGFAGGIAGALVGTAAGGAGAFPGAVGGASVGGALGETVKRAGSGQPLDPGDIAGAGLQQGAYEVGGQVLARGALKLAKPLMKSAIRPGRLLEKFPHIIEDAVVRATPVGGGAAKAGAMRSASSDRLIELLNKAAQSGAEFSAADVTAQNRSMLKDLSIDPADRAAISRRTQAFLRQFKPEQQPPIVSPVLDQYGRQIITDSPVPEEKKIAPVLLKKIKQRAQNKASNTLKAGLGGSSTEMYPRGLAKGAQRQLETIDQVAKQEANTQRLIGLEEALKRAEARHGPVRGYEMAVGGLTGGGVGMAFGHAPELAAGGLVAAPIARMLTSPQLTSRAAIWAYSAGGQKLLRQSPRLFDAILQQMMYTEQPDATEGNY